MYIREATKTRPARVCWRYHDGRRRRERAISVTHKNLRKHGIEVSSSTKLTLHHARRLMIALERHGLELAEQSGQHALAVTEPAQEPLRLHDAAQEYIDRLEVSDGQRARKQRVLVGGGTAPTRRAKVADISLVSFLRNPWVDEITLENVNAFHRFLESGGYSEQSVRGYMVDVRAFLNAMVEAGQLSQSPAKGHRLPPCEPARDLAILGEGEVQRLLELLGDPLTADLKSARGEPLTRAGILGPAFQAALFLGLRRSEIGKLRWEDVDMVKRVVHVRGARKNQARQERRRLVPIPPQLVDYFKLKARTCDFVFTNSLGEPWTNDAMSTALRRFRGEYEAKLGSSIGFQILRRTYGSMLYRAGSTIDQVAEFLGHTETRTTRLWYAKLLVEDQHEHVASAFAGVTGGGLGAGLAAPGGTRSSDASRRAG